MRRNWFFSYKEALQEQNLCLSEFASLAAFSLFDVLFVNKL